MRLLDHLEHRALVEVGLRKDDLVGLHLVEHERKLRAWPEQREPGHGRGRDCADELVRQPAASGGERALEPDEALSRADEDDPPADARGPHELQRDRLVCRTQQADRDSRDDHRRRNQTGGREVVSRPDTEREHHEGDHDQAREDAARAGTVLARPVEARLREDKDRDRCGELEPLRGTLAPEQPPEDVPVPGDELPDDERDVDPEREPRDVEDDECDD